MPPWAPRYEVRLAALGVSLDAVRHDLATKGISVVRNFFDRGVVMAIRDDCAAWVDQVSAPSSCAFAQNITTRVPSARHSGAPRDW